MNQESLRRIKTKLVDIPEDCQSSQLRFKDQRRRQTTVSDELVVDGDLALENEERKRRHILPSSDSLQTTKGAESPADVSAVNGIVNVCVHIELSIAMFRYMMKRKWQTQDRYY